MGSASSKQPVTPARPLRNKHLSRVSDPRSPTSGILRTPIEVEQASTCATPQVAAEMVEVGQDVAGPCSSDPRSPTPGISRTPLRPTVTATLHSLVKQLSQAFTYEEATQVGAEEEYLDLPHAPEEHCKPSLETEEAEQATDFFRESRSLEMRPQLSRENAEFEHPACWQWSEDCLRMEKNVSKASPEEVEIAMGLLRLADECQSVESNAVRLPLELQSDLACVGRPLVTLEDPLTNNAVLNGKDDQSAEDLRFRDTDGLMEKRMFNASQAEELELAESLLRLVDSVKQDEDTVICTSLREVVEHSKTVGQTGCQAKEELGPQTHCCMECLQTGFLQENKLQLAEGMEGVFNEDTSEIPVSSDVVPRSTRLPSSHASKTTGVKALRQRPRKVKGKVLPVSASHGRSPLTIISDDNSPSTLAHRQVKKTLAISDSPVEHVDSTSRPLKVVRSWENVHNKENSCYTEIDN